MKKEVIYRILFVIVSLLNMSCDFLSEEKEDDSDEVSASSTINTLDADLNGAQGLISEYFYNFENNINANFFRYNSSEMAQYGSYSDYYTFRNSDPTLMSFRTFPDHLISIGPTDTELATRYPIDSLTALGSTVDDSVQMTSTPFKNLESLEWNLDAEPELQRYKLVNSDWIVQDTTLYYTDTFDVSAFWAIVDTVETSFIESGLLFLDTSEWNQDSVVYMDTIPFVFPVQFDTIKQQLSSDSLVFRVNTDCNDNNMHDGAEQTIADYDSNGVYEVLYEFVDNNNNGEYEEGVDDPIQDYNGDNKYDIIFEFVDRGNGIWDPEEPYYDIDSDNSYDLNEPYQDRNCNGLWDEEESYVDNDNSGTYTDGDTFIAEFDRGNKVYDGEEGFTLKDSDTLLYTISDKPNNLIVDWADPSSPQVLLNINLGDNVVDRWGNEYTNLIESIVQAEQKNQIVDNIESYVKIFTREQIGHVNSSGTSLDADDYYITKSEWTKTTGVGTNRFYNYHIFHEPGHLNQIQYPSYFLPPSSSNDFDYDSNNNPDDESDGFWHKNNLESSILYYTANGLLRDGEMVDTAYYDTTDIAVYFIEKSYRVESSSVIVPAGFRDTTGVAAPDTTLDDCFKVTQVVTMTMVGTGVEYGQRTLSWLVKGKGLVKSEVYVRWSESPYLADFTSNSGYLDTLNQAWIGLSRLELTSIEVDEESGVFRRLTRPVKSIGLEDIDKDSDFDFDPFYVNTQSGLHTLDLRELAE